MSKIFLVKSAQCPVCEKTNDQATKLEGNPDTAPRDGTWTICVGCGAQLRYQATDDGLILRRCSARELRELPVEHRRQLLKMTQAVLKVQREN